MWAMKRGRFLASFCCITMLLEKHSNWKRTSVGTDLITAWRGQYPGGSFAKEASHVSCSKKISQGNVIFGLWLSECNPSSRSQLRDLICPVQVKAQNNYQTLEIWWGFNNGRNRMGNGINRQLLPQTLFYRWRNAEVFRSHNFHVFSYAPSVHLYSNGQKKEAKELPPPPAALCGHLQRPETWLQKDGSLTRQSRTSKLSVQPLELRPISETLLTTEDGKLKLSPTLKKMSGKSEY